jgi:predicted O-methyltransferase YrrM
MSSGVPVSDALEVQSDQEPLATVRRVRQRLAQVGPAHVRSQCDFERVSLPTQDCDVLRDLLIAEHARVVIEVGLAYGGSALAIAEALLTEGQQEPKHVVIDAYQDAFGNAGWNAIVAAGLSGTCTLLRDRSQLALPRLVAEEFVADAAFVDGSHMFHNVFVDLYFLREIVRPGGLIILDDCHWPSVAKAVRYFEVSMAWEPVATTQPTRLHAFRLPDPPVEPRFANHAPSAGDSPA